MAATPFCTLLRFSKEMPDGAAPQPRVLLVAPMSGHFATLLAHTVRTLLPDHDVHVTDWHNARGVDLAHGPFGLDEMSTTSSSSSRCSARGRTWSRSASRACRCWPRSR